MRVVVQTSVRLRWLVVILAVVVLFFGADAISDLPLEIWPEVGPPSVEIQTEALGLSAQEVESLITVPMEADLLNGVAWMDRITSRSIAGLSSIKLIFEKGTDPIKARQMVSERLTQAYALPNVSAAPTMLPPLSSTSRVMMIGLSSREVSSIELSVLARWNIKPRLMGVPGVANVAIWGQRERQLQVQIDPKRLAFAGVTLSQVIETAGNALWVSPLSFLSASTPGTAGWVDTPNQRLGLHHVLPISRPEDLARVTVVGHEGLRLAEVADVVEDHQPLIGDAEVSGETADLLLVVEKFPQANTLEVTEQVEDVLAALSSGMTGVAIDTTVFRPATYLESVRNNLVGAGVLSAVFFILGLVVFWDDWREVFIRGAVMLVTVAAMGLTLFWSGLAINAMAAAGLVAAAVTVTGWVAGRAKRRVTILAMVILLVVVALVFVWRGSAGAFMRPAAMAYALGIVIFGAVSLTVTPALQSIFQRRSARRAVSPLIAWLGQFYEHSLTRFSPAARAVPIALLAVTLAGIAAGRQLDWAARPAFQPRDLLLTWEGVPAASLPETNRLATQVRAELAGIPGVRKVGAQVGRAVTGDQVVGVDAGEMWISLTETANFETVTAAIERAAAAYPGLALKLTTYQPEEASGSQAGERDLNVRIYGHDFDTLAEQAERVRDHIARVTGIADVQVERPMSAPQVEIEVDLAAAEKFRIKPGDVRRQAATLLSGIQVGNLFEEQKVFDVVVWGVPELRHSLTDVEELLIDTPVGSVALKDIASVTVAASPTVIARDAVSRYMDVAVHLNGRGVGSVRRKIKIALAETSFPLEYHAEVLEGAAREAERAWFAVAAGVAAVGIFLVLQAAWANWRAALIFYLVLPAAVSGGIVAAWLAGGNFGVGSWLGLVVVLALTLTSGIAPRRLLPTAAAALAVALALLPILLLGRLAGYELLRPMAVVAMGGLVTSTFVTLWGLPFALRSYG